MTKTELKEAWEKYRLRSKEIKELTYNSIIKESVDEQENRIEFLLKPENYNAFFDFYFGIGVSHTLADAPSAKFHQESYERLFADPYIVQLRQWYRGAAKSIHTNVGNVCHLKQNDELFFGLLIGQNEGHAKILLADLQVQLEFNERYIKDFGSQKVYGSWADGQFITTDNRFFKALGINKPFRGLRNGANRPDFASVDDCEDRDIARNAARIQKRVEKITGDLVKSFHFKRGRLVVPNNYIVKDGLLDGLKKRYKSKDRLDIHTVNLADNDDNPSWDERLTKADVIRIKNGDDYYTSQREDYNNPIEEGKRFKENQIRFLKTPKNKVWDCLIEWWDLSYTDKGNHKAGAILGFEYGKCHVLRIFNKQCSLPFAMNQHFTWAKEFNSKGMSIVSFYDATAAQKEVYGTAWLSAAERNNYPSIPINDHASGDKHEKIDATLGDVFHNKLLTFEENLKEHEDWEDTKNHILAFEKGTNSPDDILDCLENGVRRGRVLFGYSESGKMATPFIKSRTRTKTF